MLSAEKIDQLKSHGYCVLPKFLDESTCKLMLFRARTIVEEFDPSSDKRSYSFDPSLKSNAQRNDSYFSESLNGVRCFFETDSFGPEGNDFKNKMQSIVKIGHALHDLDPVFYNYSHSPKIHEIANDLGYIRPLIGQSRYFFRLPGSRKTFDPHQDSTVLYTKPLSCIALWLALEDAAVDNGCLWVLPGSHRLGLLRRIIKDQDGQGNLLSLSENTAINNDEFIPLEVRARTLIIFSGELIHKSNRNISQNSRQAYAMHLIEGADGFCYPQDNWLQRPGGFNEL
ncbi:MAG: phytanoyl-CoA dioxygenase family protein [Myxococcales bacterium]|nr:phytanoyl-CoA dioxygenase family protein [Myxococcales bacterium]USN50833.1 MAG: phytanoyl-CoA dioxygenase family protein [Myxococcales bacterium]